MRGRWCFVCPASRYQQLDKLQRLLARSVSLAFLGIAAATYPSHASDSRHHTLLTSAAVTYGDVKLDNASDAVLLIYNHGSQEEFIPDRCDPDEDIPEVVRRMAERPLGGKKVIVYGFCTPSRVGEYVHETGAGEPKVVKRAHDIEDLVDRFTATGVPGRNIFLVGHSAGAWASLLVARGGNVDVNAVIGFAPAFAGPKATRSPGWVDLYNEQSRYLQTAASLNALIFAFEGDRYGEVSDIKWAVSAPGIDFVPVSRGAYNDFTCRLTTPHRSVFTRCFEDLAAPRIRAFIEQRLRTADGLAKKLAAM